MNTSLKDLQRLGFVNMQYPSELRQAVLGAVSSWKDFTRLSDDVKKNFHYSNNSDGVGYEFKEGTGLKGDRKENFDATVGNRSWLDSEATKLNVREVRAFVDDALTLVKAVKPSIVQFADLVEKQFDMPGFSREVSESEHAFFVRFIHYFPGGTAGKEIGRAHVDQSCFTFHLFESDPGLQCLTYAGEWMDMPVSEGETVIIPAMQMQLRSEGKLTALAHRVIATEHTAKEGRYSAVCFIQLPKLPKYDKEKYGRLQEKEPGFNYGMSLSQFSEMFKK